MSRAHVVLATLIAAVSACTGDGAGDQHLDIVFDVCAPIAVIAPGADASQLASIDAALGSWREHGVTMAVIEDRADGKPAIEVRFTQAAPAFHGVYEDEVGVVYVNVALEDPETRSIAIAHELGHAFGLWHVASDVRSSVMNPGNLTIGPNAGDQTALAQVWGDCAAWRDAP